MEPGPNLILPYKLFFNSATLRLGISVSTAISLFGLVYTAEKDWGFGGAMGFDYLF